MGVEIVPAILAGSRSEFELDLKRVKGLVSRVQVDIIDGRFAQVETIEPRVLENYLDWGIDFEIHLMVDQPELWVPRCQIVGVVAITAQVEMMKNKDMFIADTQFIGKEVGLAYDLETSVDGVSKVVNEVDKILLLAVAAGKQGQEFDRRVLKKIEEVRKMSKRIKIGVDGGLDEERIKECLAAEWAEEMAEDELNRSLAGMEFVVGSSLWKAEKLQEKLESLRHFGVS